MKSFTGTYRSTGSNSYTCRELYGDLTLLQTGTQLTGSYKFSENFNDRSSVSFSLPESDCSVTGEVTDKETSLVFADNNEFLSFPIERRDELRHDGILRLGDKSIYVLQFSDRSLLCSSLPNLQGMWLGQFYFVR